MNTMSCIIVRSGGYSYTYFIPGPIGIYLGYVEGAVTIIMTYVSACSLCYSCSFVCPAYSGFGGS